MALVTEDGTGKVDAESYCSVAAADARHADHGNAAWAALSNDAKEQSLRAATNYIEGKYRQAFKGTRLTRAQALSWPRYGAVVDSWYVESTIVPAEVVNACADLALRASTADLAPDEERAVIREKVGPLETEYSPYLPQHTRYPAVERLLGPFVKGAGASAMLVRA